MTELVMVQLYFQPQPMSDIVRKKKIVNFKQQDSMMHIYAIVAGKLGGPALWPKQCSNELQKGGSVLLFTRSGGDDAGWRRIEMSDSVFAGMLASSGPNKNVDLLISILPDNHPTNIEDCESSSTSAGESSDETGSTRGSSESGAATNTPSLAPMKVVCGSTHRQLTGGIEFVSEARAPIGPPPGLELPPVGAPPGLSLPGHGPLFNANKASNVLFLTVMTAHKSETVRSALANHEKGSMEAEDENGNQVMHYWACATTNGEEIVEIGKCLLDAGTHVNARRQDGNTPLHCVVAAHNEGQENLAFYKALFLVCNGANIHLRNLAGETASNLLVCDGRASTARMFHLLTYGVKNER